jgi:hypothetical protein
MEKPGVYLVYGNTSINITSVLLLQVLQILPVLPRTFPFILLVHVTRYSLRVRHASPRPGARAGEGPEIALQPPGLEKNKCQYCRGNQSAKCGKWEILTASRSKSPAPTDSLPAARLGSIQGKSCQVLCLARACRVCAYWRW